MIDTAWNFDDYQISSRPYSLMVMKRALYLQNNRPSVKHSVAIL